MSYLQRCPHDEQNPYAIISNDLIRDKSISPNCRWLLIYLLSNKDGWRINAAQLIEHCSPHFSKHIVYRLIEEAITAGYMKKHQENGKKEDGIKKGFSQVVYYVSERPKFKEISTLPTLSDAMPSVPIERHIKKEHNQLTVDKEENIKESMGVAQPVTASPPLPDSDSPKKPKEEKPIERTPHVKTTATEHEALLVLIGAEKTQKAYEKLSEWKEDTARSKWKKNDYRTIKRWVIDALDEKNHKNKTKFAPKSRANDDLPPEQRKAYDEAF